MTRRMILPERVLGMSGTIHTFFGRAILPISVSIASLTLSSISLLGAEAGLERDVHVDGPAPHLVDDRHDRRLGDLVDGQAADSISLVPRRWPATLITSSTRPRMR